MQLQLTDAWPPPNHDEYGDQSFRDRCGRLVALTNTVHEVRETRYAVVDDAVMLIISIADGAAVEPIHHDIEEFGEILRISICTVKD